MYSPIMIGVGILLWIGIAKLISSQWSDPKDGVMVRLYVAYAIAIFLLSLCAGAAYRARAFGNMVLLGPSQFPEIYAMVVSGAREIGLAQVPKTFLYNSDGIVNAFARRMLGGSYVFLTSSLVDITSNEQIRFVIGHELGHHAAGHLNPWLNLIKLPAKWVPFLSSAYSRACEYTCDSAGAYLSKDVVASRSALQMLGCGCRRLNATMNCQAFVLQEQQVPRIFGFLTEIARSHPRLTRRVAAIPADARVEVKGTARSECVELASVTPDSSAR
ncbi:Protease HtpX [Pandoraea iniqua]|uniref:Protease HtpX n=1 Tax=Pandoraea iniqua TaxID=2508288 RepID=A0A5E4YHD1_9BURK|nr:M48 family metallopeptidase [Pandoraea iniqua]VVE47708.1 Protease HtpX [Pandoraea iniqua]